MRALRTTKDATTTVTPSSIGLVLLALLGGCGSDAPRECITPTMVERCTDGFCEVPAGCQTIQKIPEGLPCSDRILGLEAHQLWITRSFAMQQKEMSVGQLSSLGLVQEEPQNRYVSSIKHCEEKDCPAIVTWATAAVACNMLSAKEGRERCYDCEQRPNGSWTCSHGSATAFFDCKGYRLPSYGEWQYAAFAGALHPLLTGVDPQAECSLALFDDIAWHSENAKGELRPRGQKPANPLGLYDLFGNVAEWCDDHLPKLLSQAQASVASDFERYKALRAQFAREAIKNRVDPLWMVPEGQHAIVMGGGVNATLDLLIPTSYWFPVLGQPKGVRCVRTLE